MNTSRIGGGRPPSAADKKVAPKPKLNLLAWSEASAQERARFISAVGRGSVELALNASEPLDEVTWLSETFHHFESVLRSASEPARQTFLERCRDEIIALAQAADPPIAVASSSAGLAPSTAPLARANAEGGGVGHE